MAFDSIFKADLFQGHTLIVTGGGSGIGRCTAHELAALGARVILVGRKPDKLQQVAQEITEDGGVAHWQACDIRDEEAVKALVTHVLHDHGPIHGLVNNAGGQYPSPLAAINQKGFETVLRTNLVGGFPDGAGSVQPVDEQARRRNRQHARHMWGGMPGMGHSGAARSGMDNFTKTAAFEWAMPGARQRRGAWLDRLQRHGHLRRRVQGGDSHPA